MSSSGVRNIERLRSEKLLSQREKGWNSDVNHSTERRRLLQMSTDIKSFILRSMSDPAETQKQIEQAQRRRKDDLDSFSKISSTLGFRHHEGTDRALELKVVKIVMIREGLVMNLQFLCEKAVKNRSIEGSNILELLFQLRETTLNYLEALCLWRQASQREDEVPLAFLWEDRNYTIKLIHDMDFLAENEYVTQALGIDAAQLVANPLMLSNNLDDLNTWMDPHQRAAIDTGGDASGPEFESRLRLRFAERVLLQELELHSSSAGADIFITQQTSQDLQQTYGDVFYEESRFTHVTPFLDPHLPHALSFASGSEQNEEAAQQTPNFYGTSSEPQAMSETVRSQSHSAERRVKTTESALPQTRSSTASFGFTSAPSSASRQRFECAPDLYSGHWAQEEAFTFSDAPASGDVVVITGAEAVVEIPQSSRSIDSVSDLEIKLVLQLSHPPRSAMLAGSACVVLFAPGDEIPEDITWKAFTKLCKKVHLPSAMSALQPTEVPKFKVIAIQPILEQLVDDVSLESMRSNELPFEEFIAVSKLITWVKQFTVSAIKREIKAKAVSPFKKDVLQRNEKVSVPKEREKKTAKAPGKVSLAPISKSHASPQETGSSKTNKKAKSAANSKNNIPPPQGKKVVPRVSTNLSPFYQEVVEGKFKHALLLVLLAPQESNNSGEVEASETTNNISETLGDDARLLTKVYDAVNSKEALCHVHLRELVLLREQLINKHSERCRGIFEPTSLQWWRENAKDIVAIKQRSTGEMKLTISQKLIEETLLAKLNVIKRRDTLSAARLRSAKRTASSGSKNSSKQKGKEESSGSPPTTSAAPSSDTLVFSVKDEDVYITEEEQLYSDDNHHDFESSSPPAAALEKELIEDVVFPPITPAEEEYRWDSMPEESDVEKERESEAELAVSLAQRSAASAEYEDDFALASPVPQLPPFSPAVFAEERDRFHVEESQKPLVDCFEPVLSGNATDNEQDRVYEEPQDNENTDAAMASYIDPVGGPEERISPISFPIASDVPCEDNANKAEQQTTQSEVFTAITPDMNVNSDQPDSIPADQPVRRPAQSDEINNQTAEDSQLYDQSDFENESFSFVGPAEEHPIADSLLLEVSAPTLHVSADFEEPSMLPQEPAATADNRKSENQVEDNEDLGAELEQYLHDESDLYHGEDFEHEFEEDKAILAQLSLSDEVRASFSAAMQEPNPEQNISNQNDDLPEDERPEERLQRNQDPPEDEPSYYEEELYETD